MRRAPYISFLLVALFILPPGVRCQVSITGPTCVVPGTTYQYLIGGKWDSASTMQICLTGGLVSATNSTCTASGIPVSFVQVTWTGGGSGSLSVTSSNGTGTLAVTISSVLNGGSIPVEVKKQSIAYKGMPSVITCSASTGGSCSPVYTYQWQQSLNRLTWTDIPGAQGLTLAFSQPLLQAWFYRRKVTETNSGTIAYSEEAFVDVPAAPSTTAVSN